MNASYLTRLRTGAMAFEQVLGGLEVRPIERIVLYNPTKEKAYTFKKRLTSFGIDIPIEIVNSSDDIVAEADIVNCSTRSNEPVFNGNLLREGTHVNGVGSFLPHMREVDVQTLQKAAIIVLDDFVSRKEEAGEMIYAAKETDWTLDHVYGELADLEMNNQLIQTTDKEITFFKSVGTAYFGLIIGSGIYDKACKLGIGEHIKI